MTNSHSTTHALASAAFALALIIAPADADAQLGGLIKKKATEAAKSRVESKVPQAKPAEDLSKLGSPFTAASLDRVLNALEINARAWMKSDSLAKRIEPLERQMADFNASKGAEEINAYQTKHYEWTECRREATQAHRAANAGQNEAMARKMEAMAKSDPMAAQKWAMEFAQMHQQANTMFAKGDTAAGLELQRTWYKKHGMESALDLSEAELLARCGREPGAPAALATRNDLQSRLDTLRTRKRDAELAAQERARNASGMSAEDFHPMNERLERWYAIAVKGEKGDRFWSNEEGALLDARKARITRIFEMRKG